MTPTSEELTELILEQDCPTCKGTREIADSRSAYGYYTCDKCLRGKVPSKLGEQLLDFIEERLSVRINSDRLYLSRTPHD